jgi:uncharacterized protein YceK
MVKKERLKDKLAVPVLAGSLALGLSGCASMKNTDSSVSGYDPCKATTAYRAGKLNDSNFGMVSGKLLDMTVAGPARFLARGIACGVKYGEPTISVNGNQCKYDDVCGVSIMTEDFLNAASGVLLYKSLSNNGGGNSVSEKTITEGTEKPVPGKDSCYYNGCFVF